MRKEEQNKSEENVKRAGIIAVGMSEHLTAQEQSFFIAGFQECVKYILSKQSGAVQLEQFKQ